MIKSKLLTVTGEGGSKYIGEKIFDGPVEDATFMVPLGIRRIHFCAIGAGAISGGESGQSQSQGGGGGGLVWANNINVEPGERLSVCVGYSGQMPSTGRSGIRRPVLDGDGDQEMHPDTGEPVWEWIAWAYGGSSNKRGGDFGVSDPDNLDHGGGKGGDGQFGPSGSNFAQVGAGGGAAGYTGNGGDGGRAPDPDSGGASGGRNPTKYYLGLNRGYNGGGVGVKGKGATATLPPEPSGTNGYNGNPGSGGVGNKFGGGGGGQSQADAGHGAARIIWGIKFNYPDNADIEAVE